jgi:hypothetical protein
MQVLDGHISTSFQLTLVIIHELIIAIASYCYLIILFQYICKGFCEYWVPLPHLRASTWYCVIPGGYPPQDWQSLLCAGEELDLNPELLICSQVSYH